MDTIELQVELPVSAKALYAAWLDSDQHTAFTGGVAEVTDLIDEYFEAWDGYISGMNTDLEFPNRIVQSWRTTEFGDEEDDSVLELTFEDTDMGCKMTLNHTQLPDGTADKYTKGWEEHYFEPMEEYFADYQPEEETFGEEAETDELNGANV